MTVINMVGGAPTDTGFTVRTKVSSGSNVRLAVSLNSGMTSPTYFGPVTPDAQNVASVSASGLTANTPYWWQIEHGGVIDTTYTGEVTTHVASGSEMSYLVTLGSCAGSSPVYPGIGAILPTTNRLSNSNAYTDMRNLDPLFNVSLGDLDYYDLSSGSHGIAGGASLANFRRKYDDVMLQTNQHLLYHKVPWIYMWDDHDFLGNDKRGLEDTTGAANALTVYKERVPHYALPNPTDGIWHARVVGRVLWMFLDVRSKASANGDTDNSSKTMLGSTQKAWLETTLSGSGFEAVILCFGSQWTGTEHDDSWYAFQTERTELIEMFRDLNVLEKMCVIYGDRHALRIIKGEDNTDGGFPCYMAAAIDSTPSTLAVGNFQDIPERGQYGTIRVDDKGTSGGIAITYTGYRYGKPLIWHTFNPVKGRTVIPVSFVSSV